MLAVAPGLLQAGFALLLIVQLSAIPTRGSGVGIGGKQPIGTSSPRMIPAAPSNSNTPRRGRDHARDMQIASILDIAISMSGTGQRKVRRASWMTGGEYTLGQGGGSCRHRVLDIDANTRL